MRFVIQRVNHAEVKIEGECVGRIGKGMAVLVGICTDDTEATADKMVKKLCALRIFTDAAGKTNLALAEVRGELLMISQFTLYADCRRGNRPGFTDAARPELAEPLYEYILKRCRETVPVVEKGIFGADMKVELENDGPFTVLLDSSELGC